MFAATATIAIILMGMINATPLPAGDSVQHLQKRFPGQATLFAKDYVKLKSSCGGCGQGGSNSQMFCTVPPDCEFTINGNKCHLAGIYMDSFRADGVTFDIYGGDQFIKPCNSGGVTIVCDRMPLC